jgi:hypothetical protein
MANDTDTIAVTCTDTDVTHEGIILDWRGDTVRVNVNGIVLFFKKVKGTIYAANAAGMEFTIDMKGQ